jgi:hypothetical protein
MGTIVNTHCKKVYGILDVLVLIKYQVIHSINNLKLVYDNYYQILFEYMNAKITYET